MLDTIWNIFWKASSLLRLHPALCATVLTQVNLVQLSSNVSTSFHVHEEEYVNLFRDPTLTTSRATKEFCEHWFLLCQANAEAKKGAYGCENWARAALSSLPIMTCPMKLISRDCAHLSLQLPIKLWISPKNCCCWWWNPRSHVICRKTKKRTCDLLMVHLF